MRLEEINRLLAELDKLCEALEFYANWPDAHGGCISHACTICDILKDNQRNS